MHSFQKHVRHGVVIYLFLVHIQSAFSRWNDFRWPGVPVL